MLEPPSIEALRSALAPVEALRGEQSELESWVRESFSTLESLHDELSEWQRDLTREQAQLDQREAGAAEAAVLRPQLAQAQEDLRQLEQEHVTQSRTIDELRRQTAAVQAELRLTRKHAEELSDAIDIERERAFEEHRLWSRELRDMRRLLMQQSEMLVSLGAAAPAEDGECDEDALPTDAAESADGSEVADGATASREAELNRRGSSRRRRRRT
jgi:DNA repair ATPase RecN